MMTRSSLFHPLALVAAFTFSAGCADISTFADEELSGTEKIIGGENTRAPSWMVSLRSSGNHICGGSLIHANWVLTAAHCLDDERKEDLSVCVGRKDRTRCRPRDLVGVKRIKVHSGWNGDMYNGNDIALLRLDRSLSGIQPARLATRAQEPETGQVATVRGWGVHAYQNGYPQLPKKLQMLQLPYVDADDCRAIREDVGYGFSDKNNMVCLENRGSASAPVAEQSSCNGDSGGPLHFRGAQIGVVSFGPSNPLTGQCTAGVPNAYTRVSSYLGWIERKSNREVSVSGNERANHAPAQQPEILNAGIGCETRDCIWIVGTNFNTESHVDIRTISGASILSSYHAGDRRFRNEGGQQVITLRLKSAREVSLLRSQGLRIWVVNGSQRTWSAPQVVRGQ